MKRAHLAPFVLFLAALIAPLAAQPREQFLLGVMRRDGVIIPFAAFNGRWSTPWPSSLRNLELPPTLADVPPKWWGGERPQGWTVYGPDASPGGRVTASALVTVPVGREKRIGLGTDFAAPAAPPPLFELPYPKDGLAVAGHAVVEPIHHVSRYTDAWKGLPASLREEIDAAERRSVDRVRGAAGWIHPVRDRQRRTVLAEIEAWYTSPIVEPGFSVSYVEAVKKYPPGPGDDGCGLETFVSGWLHKNPREAKPRTDLTAQITYCDRNGISYLLPFGRLRAKDRTHWVVQLSSWEREWYVVVEVTPGRTRYVAEFFGGGRTDVF